MALRILAPVLAILFALYFLFKPEFFVHLAEIIIYESGPLALGLVLTVIALTTAKTATSRVCYGLSGWIRHLPSDDILNRRMAVLAILIAQTPVLGVLAAFALVYHRIEPFIDLATQAVGLKDGRTMIVDSLAGSREEKLKVLEPLARSEWS